METAISPLNNTGKIYPGDYWDSKIITRRWELCYSTRDKIYLTDEEKERFIGEIKKGQTIVEIGGNFLTTKFIYLISIREKPVPKKTVGIYKNGRLVGYEMK